MKIYVVIGYNGILKSYGLVGASKTEEGAKAIVKEHEYMLDEWDIQTTELKD